MKYRTILGESAKALSRQDKWRLLSPFLRRHGRTAVAYATLQEGLEYFITDCGYIAFTTATHPVFAPRAKRITLSEPVCATADFANIITAFLEDNPRAVFGQISEQCGEVLHNLGFKVNCLGCESILPIQTYNTQGNWKELDLIKRARNEVRRNGISIREVAIESVDKDQLGTVTSRWIKGKKINDREIWIYARRPIFEFEEDVRKFVACDKDDRIVGFAFYDPIYRDERIVGYSANTLRCDEQRFGRLATAIHMEAMDKFRSEGKEELNLCLAPFMNLSRGKFNDDLVSKLFFQLSARFGNDIYNFKGLSFHKSKYRGMENPIYFASNSWWPSNDIYLAFRSADISQNYFTVLFQLLSGILRAPFRRNPELLVRAHAPN